MNAKILVPLFSVVAIHLPGATLAATPREIFQAARHAVLAVETRDDKGERLAALTAMAIDERRLVTSCEPLYGDHPLAMLTADGKAVPVTRGAADPQRNLCLLESPIPLATAIRARANLPATGDRVYAISNALGFGIGITEGVVSGIRVQAGETHIQFSAPIAPGSEGGALLDEAGQLLGIIDYRRRDGQNINFAAPATWIGEVAQRAESQKDQQARLATAHTLTAARDWAALTRHAEAWTRLFPGDPQAHFWLGAAAALRGDWAVAEQSCREARRLDPTLLRAGIALAETLLRQRKTAESADVAQSLLALRKEDAEVWSLVGRIALAQNDLKGAEQAFRKVASINPWAIAAQEGLATVAERRGDAAALVAAWSTAASIATDSPTINLRLASAWLAAGKPAHALRVIERVLAGAPDNGDAWYWKGETLLRMRRPVQAEAAFRRSLPVNEKAAFVWSALAEALWEQQRTGDAIAAKREAVRIEPASAVWRGQLAIKLKDGGHPDEALEILQRLATESPDDPFAHRQIGFARAYQARHAESIAALERALALDPKQGKVWAALVEQFHAAGRKEDAMRAYRRLREIDETWADTVHRSVVGAYEAMR